MFVLFQQVRLLDPVTKVDRVTDVLVEDGIVRSFDSTEVPDGTEIQACQGLVLAPGLVDLYSHSGEPGFEERETLESLAAAAIAGGFTRLNLLPDTMPAIDNPATLSGLKSRLQFPQSPVETFRWNVSTVNYWGALTLNVKGEQMTELAELADAGIVGFADGHPITNLALIRRLLEYLQPIEKPIALWACDPKLAGNGMIREGSNSIRFGLPGVPMMAETAPLSALIECVAEIGTPVHLMRISTARGVELIRAAKSRGVPITASTTWLHVLLNTEATKTYDPNLRLDPPLGNPTDQAALIQAVQEGVIDAIAIDHTPYTYEEKTVAFGEAPAGAIGLELALPLLWQTFVESGRWSALDLWRSLSTRPAKCLAQKPPTIALNEPAEMVLFDPQRSWVVDHSTLRSRSSNTSWFGKTLTGRTINTWCH